MQTEQSIAIMKALADPSRLAIINSLLHHSQYVEEIAKRHGLAASTVSFHLRKLEQAGLVSSRKEQYYVVIQANDAIFDISLREIVSAPTSGRELQDGRMEEYRRKVLETFFNNGILKKLPAQQKKRLIVLQEFSGRFETERRYSEEAVTGLILPLFDDYCTIRRLLVDAGLIRRQGASYWREEMAGKEKISPRLALQGKKGGAPMAKNEGIRAELKRLYKESAPEMGIYQLRNKVNGRIFIEKSKNLEGTRNSRTFQLKMGKAVFNRKLQKDLDSYGAESFEFSVLDRLNQPETGENVERLLSALELHWQEKLQPFGENGYNSVKSFQRQQEKVQLLGGGTDN